MQQLVFDDLDVEIREIPGNLTELSSLFRGSTIWDSVATADGLMPLVQRDGCFCVQASAPTAMGPAWFGFGFLLLAQDLPVESRELFGADSIVSPRIIVIVPPTMRRGGVGRGSCRNYS